MNYLVKNIKKKFLKESILHEKTLIRLNMSEPNLQINFICTKFVPN